jgi:hypothetical protein
VADPYQIAPRPEFLAQLRWLKQLAEKDRSSHEFRLYAAVVHAVQDLRSGKENGTHDLDLQPSYADLRDCSTTYIAAETTTKPDYRLVWRELPPKQPGQPPVREIVALGGRARGEVYDAAAAILSRTPDVRLDHLDKAAATAIGPRTAAQIAAAAFPKGLTHAEPARIKDADAARRLEDSINVVKRHQAGRGQRS